MAATTQQRQVAALVADLLAAPDMAQTLHAASTDELRALIQGVLTFGIDFFAHNNDQMFAQELRQIQAEWQQSVSPIAASNLPIAISNQATSDVSHIVKPEQPTTRAQLTSEPISASSSNAAQSQEPMEQADSLSASVPSAVFVAVISEKVSHIEGAGNETPTVPTSTRYTKRGIDQHGMQRSQTVIDFGANEHGATTPQIILDTTTERFPERILQLLKMLSHDSAICPDVYRNPARWQTRGTNPRSFARRRRPVNSVAVSKSPEATTLGNVTRTAQEAVRQAQSVETGITAANSTEDTQRKVQSMVEQSANVLFSAHQSAIAGRDANITHQAPLTIHWIPPRSGAILPQGYLERPEITVRIRQRLIERGRASIYGSAGVGKTSLAIELANEANASPNYPGGVIVFQDLAERLRQTSDVQVLINELASYEYGGETNGRNFTAGAVRSLLAQHGCMLIVLDRLDLDPETGSLPQHVRSLLDALPLESSHAIFTCQSPLLAHELAEEPFALPEWSYDEAMTFLCQRLRISRSDADQHPWLRNVITVTTGLPHALANATELLLRTADPQDWPQTAEHLCREWQTTPNKEVILPFRIIFGSLDNVLKERFMLLCLLAPRQPFSITIVTRLWRTDVDEARQTLDSLTNVALIERTFSAEGVAQWRQLELLRTFATNLLRSSNLWGEAWQSYVTRLSADLPTVRGEYRQVLAQIDYCLGELEEHHLYTAVTLLATSCELIYRVNAGEQILRWSERIMARAVECGDVLSQKAVSAHLLRVLPTLVTISGRGRSPQMNLARASISRLYAGLHQIEDAELQAIIRILDVLLSTRLASDENGLTIEEKVERYNQAEAVISHLPTESSISPALYNARGLTLWQLVLQSDMPPERLRNVVDDCELAFKLEEDNDYHRGFSATVLGLVHLQRSFILGDDLQSTIETALYYARIGEKLLEPSLVPLAYGINQFVIVLGLTQQFSFRADDLRKTVMELIDTTARAQRYLQRTGLDEFLAWVMTVRGFAYGAQQIIDEDLSDEAVQPALQYLEQAISLFEQLGNHDGVLLAREQRIDLQIQRFDPALQNATEVLDKIEADLDWVLQALQGMNTSPSFVGAISNKLRVAQQRLLTSGERPLLEQRVELAAFIETALEYPQLPDSVVGDLLFAKSANLLSLAELGYNIAHSAQTALQIAKQIQLTEDTPLTKRIALLAVLASAPFFFLPQSPDPVKQLEDALKPAVYLWSYYCEQGNSEETERLRPLLLMICGALDEEFLDAWTSQKLGDIPDWLTTDDATAVTMRFSLRCIYYGQAEAIAKRDDTTAAWQKLTSLGEEILMLYQDNFAQILDLTLDEIKQELTKTNVSYANAAFSEGEFDVMEDAFTRACELSPPEQNLENYVKVMQQWTWSLRIMAQYDIQNSERWQRESNHMMDAMHQAITTYAPEREGLALALEAQHMMLLAPVAGIKTLDTALAIATQACLAARAGNDLQQQAIAEVTRLDILRTRADNENDAPQDLLGLAITEAEALIDVLAADPYAQALIHNRVAHLYYDMLFLPAAKPEECARHALRTALTVTTLTDDDDLLSDTTTLLQTIRIEWESHWQTWSEVPQKPPEWLTENYLYLDRADIFYALADEAYERFARLRLRSCNARNALGIVYRAAEAGAMLLTPMLRRAFENPQFNVGAPDDLRPEIAASYIILGRTYGERDEWQAALAAFRRAREIAPHDNEAWYNYTRALIDTRQFSGAQKELDEAVRQAQHWVDDMRSYLEATQLCAPDGDVSSGDKPLLPAPTQYTAIERELSQRSLLLEQVRVWLPAPLLLGSVHNELGNQSVVDCIDAALSSGDLNTAISYANDGLVMLVSSVTSEAVYESYNNLYTVVQHNDDATMHAYVTALLAIVQSRFSIWRSVPIRKATFMLFDQAINFFRDTGNEVQAAVIELHLSYALRHDQSLSNNDPRLSAMMSTLSESIETFSTSHEHLLIYARYSREMLRLRIGAVPGSNAQKVFDTAINTLETLQIAQELGQHYLQATLLLVRLQEATMLTSPERRLREIKAAASDLIAKRGVESAIQGIVCGIRASAAIVLWWNGADIANHEVVLADCEIAKANIGPDNTSLFQIELDSYQAFANWSNNQQRDLGFTDSGLVALRSHRAQKAPLTHARVASVLANLTDTNNANDKALQHALDIAQIAISLLEPARKYASTDLARAHMQRAHLLQRMLEHVRDPVQWLDQALDSVGIAIHLLDSAAPLLPQILLLQAQISQQRSEHSAETAQTFVAQAHASLREAVSIHEQSPEQHIDLLINATLFVQELTGSTEQQKDSYAALTLALRMALKRAEQHHDEHNIVLLREQFSKLRLTGGDIYVAAWEQLAIGSEPDWLTSEPITASRQEVRLMLERIQQIPIAERDTVALRESLEVVQNALTILADQPNSFEWLAAHQERAQVLLALYERHDGRGRDRLREALISAWYADEQRESRESPLFRQVRKYLGEEFGYMWKATINNATPTWLRAHENEQN